MSLPLCVDMDGSLILTDLLHEALLVSLKRRPSLIFKFAFTYTTQGKAPAKALLSEHVSFKAKKLPFNPQVLTQIDAAKAGGSDVWLVTASPESWANEVAEMKPVFKGVIGSTKGLNLKGANKAQTLVEKFGEGKFSYLGDSAADREVWKVAGGVQVVGDKSLLRGLDLSGKQVTYLDSTHRLNFSILKRTLRVHQWAKNLLIFVPLFLAYRYRELALWRDTLLAFLSFSFCASSVYILNDLFDLDADREHHTKNSRPLAGGSISIPQGLTLFSLLLISGLSLSFFVRGPLFIATLLGYLIITTLYSTVLKERLALDATILAFLYTYRILAGHTATEIEMSHWLLGFSMFMFTSLAFIKRNSELLTLKRLTKSDAIGRAYRVEDLPIIQGLGLSAGLISVLVFFLYLDSQKASQLYRYPDFLWMIIPALLYWVARTWLIANRGLIHEDPVSWAIKDRVSYLVVAFILVSILFARGTLWLGI